MDNIKLEEGSELMLQFEKSGGLLPAIVQEKSTGLILMMAYINSEALQETVRSGMATFWSRSRGELWKKGKTSGNLMKITDILVDCDQDCLIYQVEKTAGGACHTKNRSSEFRNSCFYRRIDPVTGILQKLEE